MSLNIILLVLAVVIGVAYFAKRSHRKQSELRREAGRR
jgi:hypothetical protein